MDVVLIFWMVLLILCIGIEVLTLGLTTIWFAAGALAAIFAALLYMPIFVQVILFLVVSLVLLFFTRPIAVKYFNRDRVKTNVESMVGRQAIVTGEIDNLQARGQVTVSGQEWSARSWDDRVRIPEGAVVVVAAISGVKLIVRMEQMPETAGPATREEPENAAPVVPEERKPENAAPAMREEQKPQADMSAMQGAQESADAAWSEAMVSEAPGEKADGAEPQEQ